MPLWFALLWPLFAAAEGLRIFWGRNTTVAVWLVGNQHQLDRRAKVLRISMVLGGSALSVLGWQIPFHQAAVDIGFVVLGSLLMVVFLYIPDASYHSMRALRWMCHR